MKLLKFFTIGILALIVLSGCVAPVAGPGRVYAVTTYDYPYYQYYPYYYPYYAPYYYPYYYGVTYYRFSGRHHHH